MPSNSRKRRRSSTGQRVGIVAVARLAGVSTATVSKILAGKESAFAYSEGTIAKVKEAAKTLDYVPSFHARSLVRRRTDTVALILQYLYAPFHGELADQFLKTFAEAGMHVAVELVTPDEDATLRMLRSLRGGMVDAIFIDPIHLAISAEQFTSACAGAPLVSITRKVSESIPYLAYDFRDGAMRATSRLVELGHHRIGFVGKCPEGEAWEGFVSALQAAGIAVNPDWSVYVDSYVPETGHEAGRRLAAMGKRPTAIFVASDLLAMGVIRGLAEERCQVPEDIAVTSLDGVKLGAFFRPSLTTMAFPVEQLTQRALAMVRAIHDGRKDSLCALSAIWQPGLVIRESCGALKSAGKCVVDPQSMESKAGKPAI